MMGPEFHDSTVRGPPDAASTGGGRGRRLRVTDRDDWRLDPLGDSEEEDLEPVEQTDEDGNLLPFQWAPVFQLEGSPHVPKSNWRVPEGMYGKYAFIKLDGDRVYNAADAANLLAGKRVSLLGDSLMQQFFDMFIVSLQKYGYERFIARNKRRYHCNGTVEESMEAAEARFVAIDVDGHDDDGDARRLELDLGCDLWIDTFTLGGPFNNLTWNYYRAYRLPVDGLKPTHFTLWPAILDHVFANSDVVVANLGLHYVDQLADLYSADLAIIADRLEAFNNVPGKLGFFKETTPQHFCSKRGSGAYEGGKGSRKELSTCHPAPQIHLQLWRHQIMEEVAKARNISIMEGFWLQNMHNFHFANLDPNAKRDCTHFAFVVEWWVPLFDSLFSTARTLGCDKQTVTQAYCHPYAFGWPRLGGLNPCQETIPDSPTTASEWWHPHRVPALALARVVQLVAGKRLAFVGDSLVHHFSDIFTVSLQKYGYERFVAQVDRRRYHCNGTFEKTTEEAVRRLVAIDYYEHLLMHRGHGVILAHRDTPAPGIRVVANLGFHYGKEKLEWYKTDLTDFGNRLEAINKVAGKIGICNETSPQHFYSPIGSGAFDSKDGHTEKLSTSTQPPTSISRHHVMESIAGPREVPIMEGFWLQNMHNFYFANDDPEKKRDCTHFASVVEWTLRTLGCSWHLVTEAYCQPFIYDLKSCESGLISYQTIEATRRAMSRKFRRSGKIWDMGYECLLIFQKRNPTGWIARISEGQIFSEMNGVCLSNAQQAAKLAASKLNLSTKFVQWPWHDRGTCRQKLDPSTNADWKRLVSTGVTSTME
eukprot:SM000025S08325  [mRNA]  locus=s25:39295:48284:- [translate_table: standard]